MGGVKPRNYSGGHQGRSQECVWGDGGRKHTMHFCHDSRTKRHQSHDVLIGFVEPDRSLSYGVWTPWPLASYAPSGHYRLLFMFLLFLYLHSLYEVRNVSLL